MAKAQMTLRFDSRFDEPTSKKLIAMSKQTGLTKSQIVRLLILSADPAKLK